MTAWLAEYWVQLALALYILGAVWLALRTLRVRAPYLVEGLRSTASVEVGDEGIGLRGEKGTIGLQWSEVVLVRVRTTGSGPLGEDLYMEFEDVSGRGRLSVPSGAGGFEGLLERIGTYLPGFDMDSVVEAAMRMEDSEVVVWRRG